MFKLNSLDQDQARHSVRPDLGLISWLDLHCFQEGVPSGKSYGNSAIIKLYTTNNNYLRYK